MREESCSKWQDLKGELQSQRGKIYGERHAHSMARHEKKESTSRRDKIRDASHTNGAARFGKRDMLTAWRDMKQRKVHGVTRLETQATLTALQDLGRETSSQHGEQRWAKLI